jgi:hypothetical protein
MLVEGDRQAQALSKYFARPNNHRRSIGGRMLG